MRITPRDAYLVSRWRAVVGRMPTGDLERFMRIIVRTETPDVERCINIVGDRGFRRTADRWRLFLALYGEAP